MKALILGNSHIAALREAHVRSADRWGFEPVFMGAHKGLILHTRIVEGTFRATSRATEDAFERLTGRREIPMDGIGHIFVVGSMVAVALAANLWRDARWPGLPSLERETDIVGMDPRLIARETALESLAGALAERSGPRLVRQLRDDTDLPITIVSQPRTSAVVLKRPTNASLSQRLAIRSGDGAELSALFDEAAALTARRLDAGYLAQPSQSIIFDLLTRTDYMAGATRLTPRPGVAQPEDDVLHGNADYGALILDEIADRLKARGEAV